MSRFLGGVLTGIGVLLISLTLPAIAGGGCGYFPDYNGLFVGIGVAGTAIGAALCFAGWWVDRNR